MNDEPPLTSPSQDAVTIRLLIGIAACALSGLLAYYATKLLRMAPGNQIHAIGAAGEFWSIHARMGSQLQRADHVAFYDDGNRLAMSCPRYSKITLWDCSGTIGTPPVRIRDVDLQGRPVGLTAFGDRIAVLQRPPGDDRHIKPGFFEVFDRDGTRVGGPVEAGWEPDQIEFIEREGQTYALMLFSGSAEGETNRGAPSLVIASFDRERLTFERLSHVDFETNGEDPLHFELVNVTAEGKTVARVLVSFGRKPGAAWVDWTDPMAAKITARHTWPDGTGEPARYVTDIAQRRVLAISGNLAQDSAEFPIDGGAPARVSIKSSSETVENSRNEPEMRFVAIDQEKGVFGRYGSRQGVFLEMPLRGPYGIGSVRLTDVAAFEPQDGRILKIAAIDRSGGLHWIGGVPLPTLPANSNTVSAVPSISNDPAKAK